MRAHSQIERDVKSLKRWMGFFLIPVLFLLVFAALASAQVTTQSTEPTQPVAFDISRWRAIFAAALLGAVVAFYNDLNQYLKAKETAKWDWAKTGARVGAGALGGIVVALGLTLPA